MTRNQLEHIVRTAAAVTDVPEELRVMCHRLVLLNSP